MYENKVAGFELRGAKQFNSRKHIIIVLWIFALILASCSQKESEIDPTTTATLATTASATPFPPTASATPTITSSLTPTQTQTPTPSPTPWPPQTWLFPDSEAVYSPSAIDFDVLAYLEQTKGFLSTYRQYLMSTAWTSGADLITLVAQENSINPRLLLALLEFQSGCVLDQVENADGFNTAMGATQAIRTDMYGQLVWAVQQLSTGYYGWKTGALTEFTTTDGIRFQPDLTSNAGSVAIQFFFAQLYDHTGFEQALSPQSGFLALYEQMFGNPWERAAAVEPLIPLDLIQPELTLPFNPGKKWAFTGGPHHVFEGSGPLGALDFAPPTAETGCWESNDWVVAMTGGVIVRSGLGLVIQDVDGDGHEQTGWNLMYLHIKDPDRVAVGTVLKAGENIGHPSCLGGRATGTHVHIARKYNGEWIAADGPIPFVMDGWTVHNGDAPYLGALIRGEDTVIAHQYGSFISRIGRDE